MRERTMSLPFSIAIAAIASDVCEGLTNSPVCFSSFFFSFPPSPLLTVLRLCGTLLGGKGRGGGVQYVWTGGGACHLTRFTFHSRMGEESESDLAVNVCVYVWGAVAVLPTRANRPQQMKKK